MAKETYVGGTNNKSKHVPDIGYIGIPVNGVGKSKKIIKGYIGNAQNKAKLFWEFGGDIDPRFVARWTQKYVSNVGYNINLEDVGKTIKYPFIRALWLSEGVDDAIYQYFKKRYKHLNTIIERVRATMSANNLNVVRLALTIRGRNVVDDSVVFTIQMGVKNSQSKFLDYGNYSQGGRFAYEFVNESESNGVAFKKLMYAEVYQQTVAINEQDYTSNSRLEATFSSGSENPFYCYGTNAGITFVDEQPTDLVDIIDFQGKTKEFEKYIISDYSLNAAITPSESAAYNNVQIDANGATMTNDVCCITIPEWWVWGGLFYIELDLGYMPSSVATQSDYIYLLSFNAMVGIAYNKTQGVWGVWDRENGTLVFRPSKISALDYFANKKVQIIFDETQGTVTVMRGNTTAFVSPFTYRGTFSGKIEAADLYLGGYRTVSARDANCVAGMVTKAIRVYKNRIKGAAFQYPDPQAGVVYEFNYCDLAAFLMYMMREFARIYGPVGNYDNFQEMFEHEAQIINYFTTNNSSPSKTVYVIMYANAQGWYRYGVQQDRICIEVIYPSGNVEGLNRELILPENHLVAPLPSSGNITDTFDTRLINYSFSSIWRIWGYYHKQINIYPNGDYYEDPEQYLSSSTVDVSGIGFTNGYERSYYRYRWYGYHLTLSGANLGLIV